MFEKLLSANLSAALFPAVIVEALGHILHFAQTAREPNPPLPSPFHLHLVKKLSSALNKKIVVVG